MAWPEGAGVGVGAVNKMPRYFHRAASSLYIEHKSTARLRGGVGRCSRSSHTDVYAPGAVLRPPPPQSRSLRFLSPCIKPSASFLKPVWNLPNLSAGNKDKTTLSVPA